MSLQHYRSQLTAQQNRRLMLYLFLAMGVHVGGLWLWHSKYELGQQARTEPPTPIDFVDIAPNQAEPPSKQTDRRAPVNSTAKRNTNSDLPAQADIQTARPASPSASTIPSQIQRSVVPSVPTPLSDISQVEPSPPRLPTESILRSAADAPVPTPIPQSIATELGDPLTASASLEGQELNGQLNANRSGNGLSVDAVQDEVWGNYLSSLNQSINRNWQRVSVIATRRTRIRFRVDRQGNLIDLRLVQPSGDTGADQAAIQAVRVAAPFAPLPQNASEEILIVNFTFTQWQPSVVP